jgi:hypothetical protein
MVAALFFIPFSQTEGAGYLNAFRALPGLDNPSHRALEVAVRFKECKS